MRTADPIEVPLKTFIVEDSPTVRDNLVSALEESVGIELVGFADSETKARAWFTDNRGGWDLAIVDLFLRGGSGLGVLEHLRDRPPELKVVIVSNYATPEIRRRCLQLRANAVFDKSQEIELLFEYCLEQSQPRQ